MVRASGAANQRLILVLGPARSGKSEWAEALARRSGRSVTYIATSVLDPDDQEWQQRIHQHRQRRPPDWQTLEVPLALTATLVKAASSDCLLVDSLGTWVANGLEQPEADWQQSQQGFLAILAQCHCQVILVAEEVGWGVVPAYPLGRVFRDRLGHLVRHLGGIMDIVYLVSGGYVLNLSQLGQPLEQELSQPE
uniref:Adenosylcobinamide kinase n=1 Tax=Cyanothece sp. (strain PCC 7425 / ATCC 29141) TaxID=395961 RepID=B8HV30_CYAP4